MEIIFVTVTQFPEDLNIIACRIVSPYTQETVGKTLEIITRLIEKKGSQPKYIQNDGAHYPSTHSYVAHYYSTSN